MQLHGPGPGETVTAPLGSPAAMLFARLNVKKWFTTVRAVKDLYFRAAGGEDVLNEEIILLSNAAARLKHSNIKTDSERIKRIDTAVPPDLVTALSANQWINLSHGDIVRGSVQVFDGGEVGRLFVEGSDYDIDYKSGRVRRIQVEGAPGSAKSAGIGDGSAALPCAAVMRIEQSFRVHYAYFTPYLKDRDYHINYRNGLISRNYDGSIAAGEKVFVDYATETNIDHVVVEEAIDQAHTIIMQHILPGLEGTQADGLRYAETYFALAHIALASAADMLESRRNDEVDDAARETMSLSREYEERGWRFLSPFVRTQAYRKGAGGAGKNLSWSNHR